MAEPPESIGRLAPGTVQDSLIERTFDFVWQCLVPWRDDPERPFVTAEEDLNAQFHNFIQALAYERFPMVFFQSEQRQEGRRRVDISVKSARTVTIECVTYTKYKPILVIEGKRLPAPSRVREREYVTGAEALSGGIQRFKLGLHGKEHEFAIILGYLQRGTVHEWHSCINGWISDLAATQPEDWSENENLSVILGDQSNCKSRSVSSHPRTEGCKTPEIQIHHFWVCLPSRSGTSGDNPD